MESYGIIYLARNRTNGKVYVDQTVDLAQRKNKYNQTRKEPRSYFGNALDKYSMDGFEWTVIDSTPDAAALDLREQHWIARHQSTVKGDKLQGLGSHWHNVVLREAQA